MKTKYSAVKNMGMQPTFNSRGHCVWALLVSSLEGKELTGRSRCGSWLLIFPYATFLLRHLVHPKWLSHLSLQAFDYLGGSLGGRESQHTSICTLRIHKMLLHLESCTSLTTGLSGYSLFIMLSLWKSSVLKPVLLDPMAFQMFQGQHCCWWHILFLNCQGCRRIIVCLKRRESGVPSLPGSTPYCLQLDSLLEVCNPKWIICLLPLNLKLCSSLHSSQKSLHLDSKVFLNFLNLWSF